MKQTNELKALLNKLYTEEGRALVIDALVGKRTIPQEYVERTINIWEVKGDYQKAHDLAQKAGMQQRASALEEIIESMPQEQHDTEQLVTTETNPKIRRAAEQIIQQYEQAGESWNAIELCHKAVDAYYLLGQKNKAVETALEHGLVQKALTIREKEKDWMHAAIIAEANELYERAGINYERAKEYGKAGDSFVAEVEKRKNARKKSPNALVSLVSMFTNILPPKDNAVLVLALRNYTRAEWDESRDQLAVRIEDKKNVFVIYEEHGKFQAAEKYAAIVGDTARQQLYKTISYMVRPERVKEEEAKERFAESQRSEQHDTKQDKGYIQEIRSVIEDLRNNLNPSRVRSRTGNYLEETVALYNVCRDSAKIVLRKYGVGDCQSKEITDRLEEMCVKRGLLDERYGKTMRTMYTLYTLISERRRIREMDRETYTKYYAEVEDFAVEMGRVVGYTEKKQRIPEHRTAKTSANQYHQRGILERAFDCGIEGAKELAKMGVIESSYYYIKALVIVPSILALGLVGKCAYIDAQITPKQQTANVYATNSGLQQTEQKNNERGCGMQP